jgi:hypothetical protein
MSRKPTFRRRVLEFTPQVDVEMPVVRIEEDTTNCPSDGAVYDLILRDQDDYEKRMTTTLTIEELLVLRAHIDSLIKLRKNDPARQNPRLPLY